VSTAAGILTQQSAIAEGLRRFMDPPAWLGAAGEPQRVQAALEAYVPEFASGELAINNLAVKRLRLKKGKDGWIGQYELAYSAPGTAPRTVMLEARIIPPGFAEPQPTGDSAAFGTAAWRCYLPELRLHLQTQPADPALPALPLLSDPAQARELLERSIRACSPAYPDIAIRACEVKHLRYKPGSRATVVYALEYAPEHAGKGWPTVVVAKTYSGDKGQNAYDGMRALWDSPLSKGDVVTIAEPLAYLPDLKVLVQGPIQEDRTLEDLLKAAVRADTAESMRELDEYMRKTARGLAALHNSGVDYGATISWAEELAEVREVIDRLAIPLPQLADAAEPLLTRLEALDAESQPDPALPAHRAFRPAQVLIHQGQIGFIDFDGFGRAEPALDLSRFLRKTKALGLDAAGVGSDSDAGSAWRERMDAVCETFLAEYEQHIPVSRERIALWETLDLLTLVLYCWTKIEPERLNANMRLLERHLLLSGQVDG
jgi:hypothetical protein